VRLLLKLAQCIARWCHPRAQRTSLRNAKTGNPNQGGDSAFSWPPFKRPNGVGRGNDKYIILKSDISEGVRPREAQCDFFEPLFLRSVLGGVTAATP
jgi:hypothetical protein